MPKLIWRVDLVADLGTGVVSETEVARIERDDFAVPETLGLTLEEGKRVAAAIQAVMVCAQVAAMGTGSAGASTVGQSSLVRATTPRDSARSSVILGSGSVG